MSESTLAEQIAQIRVEAGFRRALKDNRESNALYGAVESLKRYEKATDLLRRAQQFLELPFTDTPLGNEVHAFLKEIDGE